MLTLVNSNTTNKNDELDAQTTPAQASQNGEELLMSFLLWDQKFEGDSHDALEDPIDVFLCAQQEKPLTLV